jgi:hypothetical protein
VTVVSVCSAKGSPGVTTLACAFGAVWPAHRPVTVAECDPSGGDIAPRFGLPAKRGTTSLVLEGRHCARDEEVDLEKHLQALPGGLEVLVGPCGAAACRTVDVALPQCLRHLFSQARDVVVDCGRIQPGAPGQIAVLASSDHVIVVVRPTVEAVASTRWIAERLGRAGPSSAVVEGAGAEWRIEQPHAWLVVVGEGAVRASHASDVLGLRLLATVREDRLGAAAFRGEAVKAWRLARSDLVVSVKLMVETLLAPDAIAGTSAAEIGDLVPPGPSEGPDPCEPQEVSRWQAVGPGEAPPIAPIPEITASNGRVTGR